MRLLGLLLIAFVNIVQANEAVQDFSGQFFTGHSQQSFSKSVNWGAGDLKTNYEIDRNSLDGSITLPVESVKYLGISISANQQYLRNRTETHELNGLTPIPISKTKSTAEELVMKFDAFFRNPEVGGLLIGYQHEHIDGKYKEYMYTPPVITSTSTDVKTAYTVGHYYFDKVTLSGKLSKTDTDDYCCDINKKTAELTWYPFDYLSVYGSVSKFKFENVDAVFPSEAFYHYRVGGEFQPEHFNSKLKISAFHDWVSSTNGRTTVIDATYYYQNFSILNSTPAIQVVYTHTNTMGVNDDYLWLKFGFMFDNRISLKDRDRKYLFSTGYQ